ncbi:MAG: biotin--[acetyl-CoA-carboxylase] ligase [Phycisphaerales bacterium]|nr:biotin--[acetyl-CoA-carboxylase] ligase [Phycisphaerales bacterium]
MPYRPLKPSDLLPKGPLRRVGQHVYLHDSLPSTNAFLLAEAGSVGDGAVVAAEYQTAGRGRLGRRWEAPRGSSLLVSILLIEPPDSPLLTPAALLAAVAACEAVTAATTCEPQIRWPNDVVCDGRKLGGVLAESRPLGRKRALVLGIGLNCLQHRGHFAGDLATKATSLELECTQRVERGPIAAALLARLDAWIAEVSQTSEGPVALWRAWRMRCPDVGARVTLHHDARTYTGTAVDVTDEGHLIVELDEGGRRVFAAETTTRDW